MAQGHAFDGRDQARSTGSQCSCWLWCRNAFWLNARAGGEPQTADAGASLKQPLRLDPVPVGCSGADPLLWSPLSSDAAAASQPRQRAAGQIHCPDQPAAATAQDLSALHHAAGQRQPASVSSVQPVPRQGQLTSPGAMRAGSGLQISAHRTAASSAPITIGGRQHDWWTLQLQEQRTGFVKQVGRAAPFCTTSAFTFGVCAHGRT